LQQRFQHLLLPCSSLSQERDIFPLISQLGALSFCDKSNALNTLLLGLDALLLSLGRYYQIANAFNGLQQIAEAAVLKMNRNRLRVAKLCQFASSTGAMLYLPTLERAEWLMSIRQAICLMISGEWH
jgi:hypothetical protein